MDIKHTEVKLCPYDPRWETEFEEEKGVLSEILAEKHLYPEILHVGCTSIVGLTAKPIIDILVLFPTDNQARAAVDEMVRVGYTFLGDGGRKDRYFLSSDDSVFPYYLHVTTRDNQVAKDQLTFKKILQNNDKILCDYMAVKHQAAFQYPNNRYMYRITKGYFIDAVLRAFEYGLSIGNSRDSPDTPPEGIETTTE